MSSKDFFDINPTFKLKAEKIIKANDLKLLQAFIGVRNSIAFLQYNASFFITKLNVRQAHFQATISAPIQVKKYLCEAIERSGKVPPNAEVEVEVENIISNTKQDLKKSKLIVPKMNCEYKFLLDDKSSDVRLYVEETNVGSLCTMSKDLATDIYDNTVEKAELEQAVKKFFKSENPQPQCFRKNLEDEIKKLEWQAQVFSAEFEEYNQNLQNIKDGTFLSEWNKKLNSAIVEEAFANKNHLLHYYVAECHKVSPDFKHIGNCLAKAFQKAWNLELLIRVIKKMKLDTCKEVKEKLKHINIESDNFKEQFLEAFEKMKAETFENNVKQVVDGFTSSLLIEEEQNILDYLLQTAVQYKNKDNVLFLIFNGANQDTVKDISSVIDGEKLAFLEIKRLYEHMPPIELPRLSAEQIKDIFPAEGEMCKIADLIINQKQSLGNRKAHLEEMLNTKYPWYLFFVYLKNISAKIKHSKVNTAETVIEKLKKAFEDDAAVGSPEPLYKEVKDIKKGEGWFSLNTKVFKALEDLAANSINVNKAVSVIELAENIVACKAGYIKDKKQEDVIHKISNRTEKYVKELRLKAQNYSQEKLNLTELQVNTKAEEKVVNEEEKKAKEEILKAKYRKEKAEAEEQKTKEEAEAKIRTAESKVIATTTLHEEAENQSIDVTSIDAAVKEFLLEVFTFKISYDRFISEFCGLFFKYQGIEERMNFGDSLLNEIINLEKKFNSLNKQFTKCKSAESDLIIRVPLCNNVSHYTFMGSALKKMKEMRNTAEEEKDKVEAKKEDIENEV